MYQLIHQIMLIQLKIESKKRINEYLKNERVTLSYFSTASDYLLQSVTTYENFTESFNAKYKLEGINENQ